MMNTLKATLAIAAALASLSLSQPTPARADFTTATFEDVAVGPDGTRVDFRPTGGFTSGGIAFNNNYTPATPPFNGFFDGFGVSTKVDNVLVNSPGTSQDFAHEFGAYAPQPAGAPGTGSGGSATYAVVYNDFPGDALVDLPSGFAAVSIDIANTTYVASSIKYGDKFSRAFRSGDFLRLDVIGYAGAGGSGAEVGTVSVMLADFSGATLDLLDHFKTLDLTSLTGAKSLGFDLASNVTNSFGISVPTEFAVDNVVAVRSVPEPSTFALVTIGAGLLALRRARRAP